MLRNVVLVAFCAGVLVSASDARAFTYDSRTNQNPDGSAKFQDPDESSKFRIQGSSSGRSASSSDSDGIAYGDRFAPTQNPVFSSPYSNSQANGFTPFFQFRKH